MMARSLLIAVRFHEGRYHGQADRFHGADGWPPSPSRVFQALVAGAARGATLPPEDQRALEWLERLDPPSIAAPLVRRGGAVKLYVPNNDLDARGGDPDKVGDIRIDKHWRPCFFDADEPVLYVWSFDSGASEAAGVCAIAAKLYQLGRGVDPAWATAEVLSPDKAARALIVHPGVLRRPTGPGEVSVPQHGTLASLIDRHRQARFTTEGTGGKTRQLFAQPPRPRFRHIGYDTPPRRLHFELRGEAGFAPRPLAAAAALITGLRDAAAKRLTDEFPDRSALFETLIVGRGAGPRELDRRIRIMPVPSIGFEHADPSIRRITVEVPVECPIRSDDLEWAFAGLELSHSGTGAVGTGRLVSTEDSRMAERFMGRARIFRSITAAALSAARRRPLEASGKAAKSADERSREEARAAGAVMQALRHAGVRNRPSHIRVQREPFQRRGVRAEHFAPASRFSKHSLWHVELRFREAITGPLVIGDGRFCGLGLMQPVEECSLTRTAEYGDVIAFNLKTKRGVAPEDGPLLIRSLRRALMALARDDAGKVPTLFSGHEPDGAADRAGYHAHLFLAADGGSGSGSDDRITRLVVAVPWAVNRRAKRRRRDRVLFDRTIRVLDELNAGRLGRFSRLVAEPIEAGDALLGPARTWVNRTPYTATRNLKKKDDPASMMRTDLIAECHRRGLPAPRSVEVLDVGAGPRGGRPHAKLKIRFAAAIRGPLMLGRDSHIGGGLFHSVS